MTINYLKDTLFVSHGIDFEYKGQYTISDLDGKELLDTFAGYFTEVAAMTPTPTPKTHSKLTKSPNKPNKPLVANKDDNV